MANLTYAQLVKLATQAGFGAAGPAQTAAAIALAESGGNPTASHRNANGTTDYGLWQINSIHSSILKSGSWGIPADNAKMAYKVYKDAGSSFKPWVTYNNNGYTKFLIGGGATTPTSKGSGDSAGNDVTTVGDEIPELTAEQKAKMTPEEIEAYEKTRKSFNGTFGGGPFDFLNPLGGVVKGAGSVLDDLGHIIALLLDPSWWVKVGIGVGGFFLVIVGIFFVMSSTKTGKAVTNVASKI